MYITFKHTGPRAIQLWDIAEKHGIDFTGGRVDDDGYTLGAHGTITKEFRQEIAKLPYIVRVVG